VARDPGQRGLFKGCCAGLVIGGLLLAAGGFLLIRALSQPQLGAAPKGPSHGATPSAIAVAVAAQVAVSLTAAPHATFTLSEQDLTTLATAENPEPVKFREPQARIRGGHLLIAARSTLGPFETTTIATVSLHIGEAADGSPLITATVDEVDLGQLTLPDWARSTFDPRGNGALSLNELLADPAFKPARKSLDCLRVTDGGLVLGFHRPGTAADASVCGS
jgi:hypothetical protein